MTDLSIKKAKSKRESKYDVIRFFRIFLVIFEALTLNRPITFPRIITLLRNKIFDYFSAQDKFL